MPRRPLIAVALLAAAALALGGWSLLGGQGDRPTYRFAKVERGALTMVVTASGKLEAVTKVDISSQLSGQIREVLADFNTPVQRGQVIARLDADHIEARLLAATADTEAARATLAMQQAQAERARAEVLNARAQLRRAEVSLADAERELRRRDDLVRRGVGSQSEGERAVTGRDLALTQIAAAEAQLAAAEAAAAVAARNVEVARAQVAQRESAQQQQQVDWDRSQLKAPIDGIVVERAVDVGQTVAASLSAPVLFTIAEDLHRMEVLAAVDEADIGRVEPGQAATFTVTAYPSRSFEGTVSQIRLAPKEQQNVVTYTVVISTENADLRLLPGMTASVRIIVDQRSDVLKVSNAALRWRPPGQAPDPGGPAVAEAGLEAPAQGGGNRLDLYVQRLRRELALTPEQSRQLDALAEEARAQSQGFAGLEPEQRRQRVGAMLRRLGDSVQAMLNEEQRRRFQAMRRNFAEQRQSRAGGQAVPGTAWVMDADGQPQPVRLRIGISDGATSEIVSGGLAEGAEVIVGASRPPARPALRLGL
ncbi:MAG: hypothetical protein OHK0024_34860 [Thalassobaculales bacterium]